MCILLLRLLLFPRFPPSTSPSTAPRYAILPNGSDKVKRTTPLVKSILLYGPSGCGKTMLVEAAATSLGAMVIDLSAGLWDSDLASGKIDPGQTKKVFFCCCIFS